MKNKNEELKDSLIKYIEDHPNERLWQSIRNWSEADAICMQIGWETVGTKKKSVKYVDTYYLENRKLYEEEFETN